MGKKFFVGMIYKNVNWKVDMVLKKSILFVESNF